MMRRDVGPGQGEVTSQLIGVNVNLLGANGQITSLNDAEFLKTRKPSMGLSDVLSLPG